jgi:hypothetical protein
MDVFGAIGKEWREMTAATAIPSLKSMPRAVIMDLGGVLFARSTLKIIRKLSLSQMALIAMTSCDMDAWRTEFFQMLNAFSLARPDLIPEMRPVVSPVKAPSYEGIIVPTVVYIA